MYTTRWSQEDLIENGSKRSLNDLADHFEKNGLEISWSLEYEEEILTVYFDDWEEYTWIVENFEF